MRDRLIEIINDYVDGKEGSVWRESDSDMLADAIIASGTIVSDENIDRIKAQHRRLEPRSQWAYGFENTLDILGLLTAVQDN
jgi:hypothetical protein